jgi:hypothetical protein
MMCDDDDDAVYAPCTAKFLYYIQTSIYEPVFPFFAQNALLAFASDILLLTLFNIPKASINDVARV